MIEEFLMDKEEFRYTIEQNIVTRNIIYFFKNNILVHIGINNHNDYQNWY